MAGIFAESSCSPKAEPGSLPLTPYRGEPISDENTINKLTYLTKEYQQYFAVAYLPTLITSSASSPCSITSTWLSCCCWEEVEGGHRDMLEGPCWLFIFFFFLLLFLCVRLGPLLTAPTPFCTSIIIFFVKNFHLVQNIFMGKLCNKCSKYNTMAHKTSRIKILQHVNYSTWYLQYVPSLMHKSTCVCLSVPHNQCGPSTCWTMKPWLGTPHHHGDDLPS